RVWLGLWFRLRLRFLRRARLAAGTGHLVGSAGGRAAHPAVGSAVFRAALAALLRRPAGPAGGLAAAKRGLPAALSAGLAAFRLGDRGYPAAAARSARGHRLRAGLHVGGARSEEHTSELQSRENLVCRLLLEKKKKNK